MLREGPISEQTLAIFLGASWFTKARRLAQGSSFYNSAADLRDYLIDPDGLGLSSENIAWLFDDSRSPGDQLEEIVNFLQQRTQASQAGPNLTQDLLIYYVGHGLFTRADQAYCLAVRSTNQNNEGSSSIRVSDLAAVFKENARFLRRYFILDCCFSAQTFKEFQSAPLQVAQVQLMNELPRKGTTLLCSSNAQEPSLAPANLRRTMFSDSLMRVLKQGHPSLGQRLSMNELGDLIKLDLKQVYSDRWVRPEVLSPDQKEGDIADVPLFPNPAFVSSARAHSHKREESKEKPRYRTSRMHPVENQVSEAARPSGERSKSGATAHAAPHGRKADEAARAVTGQARKSERFAYTEVLSAYANAAERAEVPTVVSFGDLSPTDTETAWAAEQRRRAAEVASRVTQALTNLPSSVLAERPRASQAAKDHAFRSLLDRGIRPRLYRSIAIFSLAVSIPAAAYYYYYSAGKSDKLGNPATLPQGDSLPEEMPTPQIADLLRQGAESYGAGNYDEAIKSYEAVLAVDATNPDAKQGLLLARNAASTRDMLRTRGQQQ